LQEAEGGGPACKRVAPKTQFGIALRNLVLHATRIPGVAKVAMSRDLTDKLQLPSH
jgi:hypothetical protein